MIVANPHLLKYEIISNDINACIKPEDRILHSARAWDYDAIFAYGEFNENSIILDIGGGLSYFYLFLSRIVRKSYCIDNLSFEGGKEWFKTLVGYDEVLDGRAVFIHNNAKSLPFPNNYFDTIYTTSALEHFADNDDILCAKEINRCLKPNGVFVGTVDYNPVSEHPTQENTLRLYTHASFLERIYSPAGLVLCGEDYLLNSVAPDTYPLAQALFFKMRKV